MGKGKRMRTERASSAHKTDAITQNAARIQRIVRILCIIMLPIMLITLLVQLWSIVTINANLQAELYTAEEAAALTRLLPLGWFGVIFMLIGAITAAVLLLQKKWKPSLIGTALTVVAGILLVLFALSLGEIFAYDALKDRGLKFSDLVLRHFTVLLTPFLLIPACVLGQRAAKKRELAQMTADMNDNTPTISLQENTNEED